MAWITPHLRGAVLRRFPGNNLSTEAIKVAQTVFKSAAKGHPRVIVSCPPKKAGAIMDLGQRAADLVQKIAEDPKTGHIESEIKSQIQKLGITPSDKDLQSIRELQSSKDCRKFGHPRIKILNNSEVEFKWREET